MGFFGQEYWSGLPCPPPWVLPDSEIEPISCSSCTDGRFFTSTSLEKNRLYFSPYKEFLSPTTTLKQSRQHPLEKREWTWNLGDKFQDHIAKCSGALYFWAGSFSVCRGLSILQKWICNSWAIHQLQPACLETPTTPPLC